MSETLRTLLSPIYWHLLPDFFGLPTVEEPRATCATCAMCDPGNSPPELGAVFFRPDLKCCTYHPTLPNYLVGAILDDSDPGLEGGRTRIREKLERRIGVTPQWLAAPKKYLLLLDVARESSFGRSEALLCPYYEREGGLCSIWKHRESVCATFFCKHVAGAAGKEFWTAFKDVVTHFEVALSRYLAFSISPGLRQPEEARNRLTREDLEDRPPDDAAYARLWGDWLGREEAFYVECKRRFQALSPEEFARIVLDVGGRERIEVARARYEAVTRPTLGTHLVLNPRMDVTPATGGVAVTPYSRYDSFFLTEGLYDALRRFSPGEPARETLARMREEGTDLPDSLLLQLQLYGVVLVPPDRGTRDG